MPDDTGLIYHQCWYIVMNSQHVGLVVEVRHLPQAEQAVRDSPYLPRVAAATTLFLHTCHPCLASRLLGFAVDATLEEL